MSSRSLLVFAALVLVGCSSPRVRHNEEAKPNPENQKVEATPPTTAAPMPALTHEVPHEVTALPEGIAPETALKWLKNGNKRYLKAWYRKDGKTPADREKLVVGQKPHTIVLSCADSRVPPEHVFDQTLGEIFTVRVAGEALDSSVIASIEYAASHLGSRLILVMAHTQCGAVAAAIEAQGRKPAGSPSLDNLVADIGHRIDYATNENKTSDLYKESLDNAKGVAADLVARSDILRSLVAQGQLKIATAIYNLKTGSVDFE